MTNEELQSKVISYLRFPLIIGVVLNHSYLVVETNITNTEISSYIVFNTIRYYFSNILTLVAIPLFFLFSGFLFFYKIKIWNIKTYISKLKKRVHSLLIPYIFWISLALLIFFVAQNTPYISSYFSNISPIKDYSISDFLKCFWVMDYKTNTFPFLYQFWFIRDLMVICILSPIVYILVRYLKIYGIILLLFYYFFAKPLNIYMDIAGLSSTSIAFFSIGAYFSINKLNIIEQFNKIFYPSLILYPILTIADLLTINAPLNIYIHKIGILAGIVFFINITCWGIKNNKIKPSVFLANISFFVFAFHEPWLMFIRKILFIIIKPSNELSYIIIYFGQAILVITLAFIIYYIISKITPKFLAVITGGR